MKRICVFLAAVMLLSGVAFAHEDCPCEIYDDITPEAWYHDETVYAIEHGLMNGISERRFDPNGCVSRAMLVTILYRCEGAPDVSGLTNPFVDVLDGQWYAEAVTWAFDNGIVNGVSPSSFAPNRYITREQIAAILYRYAQFKGEDVSVSNPEALAAFPDCDIISAYAVDAVTWTVERGIIKGIYGTLSSEALAVRAEIAAMLMRYLEM